jgi:uncharacterized protein involved in cysteine biosynthesis
MSEFVIVTTVLIGVLTFIAASAWKDLIEDYIDAYIPSIKDQLRWKTAYVITLTVLLVLIAVKLLPTLDHYMKN